MDQSENRDGLAATLTQGFLQTDTQLLLIDSAGDILMASAGAARLFKVDQESLIGTSCSHWFMLPSSVENIWTNEGCEGPDIRELEMKDAGGEIFAIEVDCTRFSVQPAAEMQEQLHWLLMLTDVRQREHQDELRAVRLAKLSLLNQVSEALYGANLTLDQILEALLICVTAGQGLRFNRAFLLLIDEQRNALQGELAIGPSNADEAARIWHDLAGKPGDLFEMMTSYDKSIKQTDVVVNQIVRHMTVPLGDDQNLLVRAMFDRQSQRVTQDLDLSGAATIRHWLGCSEFAVAPLTTRGGPLGVIIADNAISGNGITDLDLEFLQMFANQSSGAIENSRLYHELEKRLLDLHKAHQKQKDDQENQLRMERLSVMGETSAIVAHELRNPLVAIGGFARTLLRNLEEEDPNREFAHIITEEVARLERIIHDLLDFIRPQKMLRKSVTLDHLIADTLGKFQPEMEEKEILLEYDLQAGHTQVNCHPGEIQQVLQNLIINAAQVLRPGGRITAQTRVLEGGVKVALLDNGPGFAEDVREKLFSPFFSTKPTGSGLGLTICSQIIKAHGGVLGAENRPEGGASFSFILPLPKG